MKKLARLLLILLASLGTLQAEAQVKAKYKLLWEIKKQPTDRPSYLFGTMHLRDERVFNLPDSLILAIEQTDGFALEVDFDAASYTFLSYLYEDLGGSVLDEAKTEKTAKAEESVQPVRLFEKMTHANTSSHDQMETFLDAYLYRYAKSWNKEICGLESLVSQMQLLDDPEYSVTGGNLKSKLRLIGLVDTYAEGDLDAIDKMVNQEDPSSYFSRKIIVERNLGMASKADSLIRIRPTFLGVGAAHLPGKQGVIELLREKGYQLRPVVATFTGMRSRMWAMPYKPDWSSFEREIDGYRLQVPSPPFPIDTDTEIGNIYVGADIPGGLEYGFFSFSLGEALDSIKQRGLQETLAETYVGSGLGKPELQPIQKGEAKGFESISKRSGQYFRIQTLFTDDRVYCLTWSGAKSVVESEAADKFFESIEILQPKRLADLPLLELEDKTLGFKMRFPGHPDISRHRSNPFDNGGKESINTIFSLHDHASDTYLSLLVEDFKSPEKRGTLDSIRMEDAIYYMGGVYLEPTDGYQKIVVNGLEGLEAKYESEDYRYRQRMFMNANRLYLLTFYQPKEEDLPAQIEEVFTSFSPQELPLPKLVLPYEQDRFRLMMPAKTNHWGGEEYIWTFDHDTAHIDWSRDPASSLNFVVFSSHHNKYVNGSETEMLNAAKRSVGAEDFPATIDERQNFGEFPALRFSYKIDSNNTMHYLFVLTAEFLYELRAQTPSNPQGDALAQKWIDGFSLKPGHHVPDFDHGKLNLLLADIASEDSTTKAFALDILRGFRLHPDDFPLATQRILEEEKKDPGSDLAFYLQSAMLERKDSSALAAVRQLSKQLPSNSELLMVGLVDRIEQERDTAWAWQQLKAYSKESQLPSMTMHSWTNYLIGDSTGARMERLIPLLEVPHLRLQLAYDLLNTQDFSEYYTAKHLPAVAKVLALGVEEAMNAKDLNDDQAFMLSYMMYLISSESSVHWEGAARNMLKIRGNYLPSIGAIALVESGKKVDKKTLVAIAEEKKARYDLLAWIVETERQKLLPKKFTEPSYLGEVALEYNTDVEVLKIEFLEQRKIPYSREEVLIYRMQVEGKQNWQLGFAGPFPTEGPIFSLDDLYMTGMDDSPYHPVTLDKQVRAWIKSFKE